MKAISRSILLSLIVLFAGSNASFAAQKSTTIVDILGGALDFSLDGGFTTSLQGQGIMFGYHGSATDRGNRAFRLVTGTVDTTSGAGQFLAVGAISFDDGTNSMYLYRLELDSTGNSPIITGLMAINGKIVGRVPVFNVVITSQAFTAQFLQGNTTSGIVGFTVSSGFASQFNSLFNTKAVTYGEQAGTVGINLIL